MISYRIATPDDRAFCRSAWSSSYKDSHAAGMIGSDSWADVMHSEIDRVFDARHVTTMVAYDHDDTDFLYGFISGSTTAPQPIVFYVYSKEAFRKAGLARGLFRALGVDPALPFVFACKTGICTELARKVPMAKWKPSAARFPSRRTPDDERYEAGAAATATASTRAGAPDQADQAVRLRKWRR